MPPFCCHHRLSCLLTGCRCCSSLGLWHHSSMHPQVCWAAQRSLGGRWSLPMDLLCQGDPEWADMGWTWGFSQPCTLCPGSRKEHEPTGCGSHHHGTTLLAHNEGINIILPLLLYFHTHSGYEHTMPERMSISDVLEFSAFNCSHQHVQSSVPTVRISPSPPPAAQPGQQEL